MFIYLLLYLNEMLVFSQAVSYTHLDVYKRQALARTAGAEQGDEFSHVYPERDLFQNRQYLCSEGVG